MRPVTDAFLRTIRGSHRMRAEARLVAPGQTGTDPDGELLPIIDGDVRQDATADIRSTCALTVAGDWNPAGDLTPYGSEVWVRRGVEFGGGAVEWISLGYHRIYAIEQDQAPDGTLRIDARDRMSALIDGRMLAPRKFTAAASVNSFFTSLVHEILPAATMTFDFDATAATLGRAIVVEEDRYGALADLARSLGKIMFWNYAGELEVRDAPDLAAPVFEVDPGADGVQISLSRSMSRDGIYNAIVATGEAPDDKPPARGIARDGNPLSPTYWSGPFGRVPRFYSSPLLTSNVAATQAAVAMLAKAIGRPYAIDLALVPNPALEPLDVLRIRHRDGSNVHAVESLDIPLTAAAAMTATTKDKTGLAIDTTDDMT